MLAALVVVLAVAVVVVGIWRRVLSLDGDRKKAIKDSINSVFIRAEERGAYPRAPAFIRDFRRDYPELAVLEEQHPVLRDECLALLDIKDRLTDVEALGGSYTTGGIHAIRWKSFMFKSGCFIEENCRLAPRTAAILRGIPGVYTAFFSILEPHQYVTPHFGYYKGFLRFHLGVIIPDDNADQSCWLRINADKADNDLRQKSLIDKGERYYWKNGEGLLFDDTFLHDAANDSSEIRVVLWLDVRRKMPLHLDLFNRLCLWVIHREPSIKRIRSNATIGVT